MATATRKSISKNVYLVPGENGALEGRKSPEATANVVRTIFAEGDTVHGTYDIDVTTLPEAIQKCAMLQGISIKLQRSFADTRGDVQEAIESYLATKELLEAGQWIGEREGGAPRISLLIEAVARTLRDNKVDVDDARRESIKAKLLTEDGRKVAQADKKVMAHFEAIKLEKAKERADAAKADAKGADSSAIVNAF